MGQRYNWDLQRAFEDALKDGRERTFSQFVDRISVHARDLTDAELAWLTRAPSQSWPLRASMFLTHAVGAVAARRPRIRPAAALLLANLAAHESPLVRSIALEWAPELGREAALQLAAKLQADSDAAVREAAEAVASGAFG